MASILSAGTTSNTALNLSADTSGVLQLATNGTTTAVTIDTSQNVGIGTASPTSFGGGYKTLEVKGSTSGNGGVFRAATSDNSYIFDMYVNNAGGSLETRGAYPIAFTTNGSERMRIDSNGRVGIGTSSPAFILDVRAATSTISAVSTTGTNTAYMFVSNTGGDFYLGRDNSAGNVFGGGAYSANLYSAGAYPMVFWTNAAERMRIDSSGRVLVGLTSANTSGSNFQVSQGITFPATQSASSDANTLDDYEEGTWTPTATGFTSSGTITLTGSYTKIGRVVRISGSMNASVSLSGGPGGVTYFSNLPFPPASGSTGYATASWCDTSTQTPLQNNVFAFGNVYVPSFSFNSSQTLFFTAVYQV